MCASLCRSRSVSAHPRLESSHACSEAYTPPARNQQTGFDLPMQQQQQLITVRRKLVQLPRTKKAWAGGPRSHASASASVSRLKLATLSEGASRTVLGNVVISSHWARKVNVTTALSHFPCRIARFPAFRLPVSCPSLPSLDTTGDRRERPPAGRRAGCCVTGSPRPCFSPARHTAPKSHKRRANACVCPSPTL